MFPSVSAGPSAASQLSEASPHASLSRSPTGCGSYKKTVALTCRSPPCGRPEYALKVSIRSRTGCAPTENGEHHLQEPCVGDRQIGRASCRERVCQYV